MNESFEGFFVEINLRSKKWLLGCSYNPHKEKIISHLNNLSTALDKLCTNHENIILLGDFNVEVEEKNMSENLYNLRNLVKQKTCFKNPENPSCIGLILTNSLRTFQNSNVFEAGLSDFHKLTTTVLKQYFPKLKPKVVNYRDYRKFHNEEFRALLDNEILKHDINNMEYQHFLNIFIEVLNKHATMKQKYLRANQGRFMTKNLHKAIMKRSRLRNKFLSDISEISRKEYKKQRNFCVNLLKRTKKKHFANLDINCISDNKKVWQTVKPLFSNKVKSKTIIKLVENDKMIDDEIKIAKILNEYFVNIVKKLGLTTKEQSAVFTENSLNEVEIAITKHQNHPSIIAITEKMEKLGNPSFFYHNFNNSLSCSTFPAAMKYAEVTPIHKKGDKTDKENYRPISILPDLSKVYERLMYNQIYPHFQTIFSKFQCGFQKGFNTQHCLLAMVEKWRKTLDGGGETGAVLTGLSKAFDFIDHNLLIAKLNAYGFDKQSINFIYSYLTKRKQRTKVDSAVSSWEMLFLGVPQGSILGPLFLNIYIYISVTCFFETPANIDFAGYADDITPYTYSSNIKNVLDNLQGALEKMFQWFSTNNLVANAKKCHLLTSSITPVDINISNT